MSYSITSLVHGFREEVVERVRLNHIEIVITLNFDKNLCAQWFKTSIRKLPGYQSFKQIQVITKNNSVIY